MQLPPCKPPCTVASLATALLSALPLQASAQAPLLAQLVPDSSLGDESSVVVPGVLIRGDLADEIRGGAARGENLFHSFAEFGVLSGQRVYFANPIGIENILSRVTGGTVSNIDGMLGVDGAANLYLLNPNGILFGPNAELDISGSFTASTAGQLVFSDGSVFSATPGETDLLTVSVPLGVQFNDVAQGNITQEGNLAVGSGETLTLFGAGVLNSGNLFAPGGSVQVLGDRVELVDQATVDVADAGGGGTILIGGDYQGQGTVPTATRTLIGPNVTINADALAQGKGGRVIVWADEATRFAGTISAQGGPEGGNGGFVEVSGLVALDFTGMVNTQAPNGDRGQLLLDPENIFISDDPIPLFVLIPLFDPVLADSLYAAAEDPGLSSRLTPATVEFLLFFNDLTLEATNIIAVLDDVNAFSGNDLILRAPGIAVIGARLGQSGGGDIILETPQAVGNAVLVDGGIIDTDVQVGTNINGGDVRITTHGVSTVNDGVISASTFGNGDAGRVEISATGNVLVDSENSFIASQVGATAEGNSGGVFLDVANLRVFNGAQVGTSTFGQGNSGPVEITATGDVFVQGDTSFIDSQVQVGAEGNSGGISLSANNLSIREGAEISASTFSRGNSGQVEVTATGDVLIEGNNSFIASEVQTGAEGDSGGVLLTTDSLSILDGGNISAGTFARGNSGQVEITATGDVRVEGADSFIASQVAATAEGNSGGISLNTNTLSIREGAEISASTFGQGNAGSVAIAATGDVLVDGVNSFIASQVQASAEGDSGGIVLGASNVSVVDGANISTNTFGQGNSGQVEITATGDVLVDGVDSFIVSQVAPTAQGDSGGIVLNTNNLTIREGAEISASTFGRGNAGPVEVTATGEVVLDGNTSFISSEVQFGAEGNSGGVTLDVNSLSVLNGAQIGANSIGQGDAGQIQITATDDISLVGASSFIASQVQPTAEGNSGGISITAPNLFVRDGANLSATTFGRGNSGQIQVTVSEEVLVEGADSFIASQVALTAEGNSGGVALSTNNLSIREGAEISASTFGRGNAGPVEVTATGEVVVDGSTSFIVSEVQASAEGDSGGVSVNANNLSVRNGGAIAASTFGQGDAGQVQITATGNIVADGGFIDSRVAPTAEGNSGGVALNATNLSVLNSAGVSVTTFGRGDSGQIEITIAEDVVLSGVNTFLASQVGITAQGNSGGIVLNTNNLSVRDGANLSASTFGQGNAGQVEVTATGEVLVTGNNAAIASEVQSGAEGDSGGIAINARSLSLLDRGFISANTFGEGDSGQVEITATDTVLVQGSGASISSQVDLLGAGDSGGIALNTANLLVQEGASVSASTFGRGNSGQVEINATDTVLVQGANSFISSQVAESGAGNSGGIALNANNLFVLEGGQVGADTFGQGDSGQLVITTTEEVLVGGGSSFISSTVGFGAEGNSGGLLINANDLFVLTGGNVSAGTFGRGDAGQVVITTTEDIFLDGSNAFIASQVAETGEGDSGGISLNTTNLSVLNNASVTATTFGQGNSGLIEINASGNVLVTGIDSFIASQVGEFAEGNSGGVSLSTTNLSVINGGEISATTFGQGNAGRVAVTATDTILVRGDGSSVNSEVTIDAEGDSGGISLNTADLSVLNNASVTATTLGQGNAGRVEVRASGDVLVDDGFLTSDVDTAATGDSGGVFLRAANLAVVNGGIVGASTFGQGNAGRVEAIAPQSIRVEGSSSFLDSFVASTGMGNSGGLLLQTAELTVTGGANVSASTFGQGNAGSLQVESPAATDLTITLGEEGFIGAVTQNQARGGDLTVSTDGQLTIQGVGTLSVASETENGGAAGNLNVFANRATIAGAVELAARSASVAGGGNIFITINDDLILRGGSFINAESTNPSGGDGGNITINTDFLIGLPGENNDVIANAIGGNGGRVEINAIDILGFSESQGLPTDVLRANTTNDLSASSDAGVEGEVALNTINVDPSSGLGQLPEAPIDASALIAQTLCEAGQGSEFTVTGRGGVPSSPTDALDGVAPWEDWYIPESTQPQSEQSEGGGAIAPPTLPQPLVEAQGALRAEDGRILLLAEAAPATPTASTQVGATCRQLRQEAAAPSSLLESAKSNPSS